MIYTPPEDSGFGRETGLVAPMRNTGTFVAPSRSGDRV
jgi:hypothetical protein